MSSLLLKVFNMLFLTIYTNFIFFYFSTQSIIIIIIIIIMMMMIRRSCYQKSRKGARKVLEELTIYFILIGQ